MQAVLSFTALRYLPTAVNEVSHIHRKQLTSIALFKVYFVATTIFFYE